MPWSDSENWSYVRLFQGLQVYSEKHLNNPFFIFICSCSVFKEKDKIFELIDRSEDSFCAWRHFCRHENKGSKVAAGTSAADSGGRSLPRVKKQLVLKASRELKDTRTKLLVLQRRVLNVAFSEMKLQNHTERN